MSKRYIITCAVCDLLAEVSRKGAFTCSGRCRVQLHRHPEKMQSLQQAAEAWKVPVFSILQAGAVRKLRPDLAEQIEAGKLSLDDVQNEMVSALVKDAIRAKRQ